MRVQGNGQHSIAAELAFQKQLAKQLGLKGRSKGKAKGPDDGLDDLLEGTVISAARLLHRMVVANHKHCSVSNKAAARRYQHFLMQQSLWPRTKLALHLKKIKICNVDMYGTCPCWRLYFELDVV